MVMDATANWNERYKVLDVHFCDPATKSSAAFLPVQREEKSLSPSEVSDFLQGKIPNSHPKDNGCSADVHTVLRVVFTQ